MVSILHFFTGSTLPLWQVTNTDATYDTDPEFEHFTLDSDSSLYQKLCKPKFPQPSPPTTTLSPGTGTASFDATLGAPICEGSSTQCNSAALLEGKVNEPNSPNTIDLCSDDDSADATHEESVKKIVVQSVKDNDLRGGELVKIVATVVHRHTRDRVDFYYTEDASNPDWKYVTSVAATCSTCETTIIEPYSPSPQITYTLPKCSSSSGCRQVRSSLDCKFILLHA